MSRPQNSRKRGLESLLMDNPAAEDLVTCSICTDIFRKPKLLTCQHTFCQECLEHVYDSSAQSQYVNMNHLSCPICRQVTHLPATVGDLKDDFRINQFIDVLIQQGQRALKKTRQVCDMCNALQEPVTSRCVVCDVLFCERCAAAHTAATVFKYHPLTTVDAREVASGSCSQHGRTHKYFCKHCREKLCPLCVFDHKSHPVVTITAAMKNMVVEASQLQEDMKQQEGEAERKVFELERHRQDTEAWHVDICQQIRSHTRKLVQQLQKDEFRILQEVENCHNRILEGIDNEIATTQQLINDVCTLGVECSTLARMRNDLRLLNKMDDVQDRIRDLDDVTPLSMSLKRPVFCGCPLDSVSVGGLRAGQAPQPSSSSPLQRLIDSPLQVSDD